MKVSRLLRSAILVAAFAVDANAGAATLSSVTPPYIQAGGPDVTLSIGGSGFVPGGTAAIGGVSLATTYLDSTKITAVLPASLSAVSGDYWISVRNPDGSLSAGLYFDIQPVLTSVTPNSAAAGSPTTPVTISGKGFNPAISLKFVMASGTTHIYSAYVNPTTMTAFLDASLLTVPGAASIQVDDPTYPVSTTLPFTITAAVPGKATLTSLNPPSVAAGGMGLSIQVNGSGFATGCTAQWNGATLSTSVINASQLSVQIPASLVALPGSGSITVVNPGAAASNALTFTITGAAPASKPNLSPLSVVAGGPAFTLTVSAAWIVAGAVVQWNGVPLPTTFVSSTQLTAQVSASLIASPGSANVTIVNPGSSASPSTVFTIVAASPVLSSLSPSSKMAGSAAFTLAVFGSNFDSQATVQWNGAPLVSAFVNSTQLTAQVPANLLLVTGTVPVTVVKPGVAASNSLNFKIDAPAAATLASISPNTLPAGSSGFSLTAFGSGFLPGSAIQWNATLVATTFVSSTQLAAQIPASWVAAGGTALVAIANPSAPLSNTLTFTIATTPPIVSSLNPPSVTSGSPAFTLTVNGSGFVPSSQVRWNGAPIGTTYVSATQLTALAPGPLMPDTISITVVNPGSAASNALTFTVVGPPATISNIAPATATAGGPAFTLTVTGTNFTAAAVVTWNGVNLATTFVNSTKLTALVAASLVAAPGSALVSISNPAGANAPAALTFTITADAPALTSLSPSSVGAGSAGFTLTVNGGGFAAGANVRWNGASLTTAFVSSSQVTAQVPASSVAAPTSASVTVVNPSGAASNTLTFTVAAGTLQPVVQRVLNAGSYTSALAPGTWAAIFGTRLAVSAAAAESVPLPVTLAEVKSVTVGGVPAPLSYVSPGQINFVIPFDAALGASVPVVVTTSNGASAPVNITLARTAPALFTQNSQGTGPAIAFDANFQPVTAVHRDAIILYAVGLGPTNPPALSVQGGASAEPLNRVIDQVQVFIGEAPCEVQFAGLAPGFPGIYQLNVVPPAAPASNRLYIVQNGVTSNVTTLPVPAGTNVANVKGSIDGLYPASGVYADRNANKSTSGPVSFSEMLNAGAATVSFEILPNAQPFIVMALSPGGTAVLQIDPAGGTWQGYVTSPTAPARVGDFSLSGIVVYDLLSGTPFPANIIPVSRFDPMAAQAATLLPQPNVFATVPSPNARYVYASRPLMQSGRFSIGSGQASDDLSNLYFGAFVNIGQPPPSSQTAEFLLFVDGVLVATKNVPYEVQ
jgi:uncharacterized protein (TIGR03437 family)